MRNYWTLPGLDNQPAPYTYQAFIWDFEQASGFTYEQLRNKRRMRKLTQYRQMAMSLLVNNFNMTKTEIGKLFNRDHTTVIHSEKQVTNLVRFDADFRNDYNVLINKLVKKSGRPIRTEMLK